MVLKDLMFTRKARIEMAEVEKQLLNSLKNNNPIKNAATSVPPYMHIKAPAHKQFKPQDMHCLKKLLEQDYPVESGAVGCLLHDSSKKCKCISHFFSEGLDYIQDEYLKYLKQKEEEKLELFANGYGGGENYIESEESDSDMDSSDSSDDEENNAGGPPQFGINIH